MMHISTQIQQRKLLLKTLEEEMMKMNAVVSDFVYFHRQLSTAEISYKDSQDLPSVNDAAKGARRNSVLPSTTFQDKRSSIAILPSELEVNNNINGNNTTTIIKQNGQQSLFTLIFHGLKEDWMEQSMETLEKKKMILEHNLRVFLKEEGLKEFEFRHLKPIDFLFRWEEGPRIVDNISAVVVNFSCLDDQVFVWNSLKEGCKSRRLTVTKDSRSAKEKESDMSSIRKNFKTVKKIDYHAHCVPGGGGCGGGHNDENDNVPQDDDWVQGDRALLFHGIESDWVEEEMMEDDVDFIRDVLETKVFKLLKSVGIQKKVAILNAFRWKEGPQYQSVPPVVVIFKKRTDYYLVRNWSQENFRKQSSLVTQDSTSRWKQKHFRLSKVNNFNIFQKYCEKFETAFWMFNEWIRLT